MLPFVTSQPGPKKERDHEVLRLGMHYRKLRAGQQLPQVWEKVVKGMKR